MWDPISIFFCMWVLNIGMPDARLKVSEIIEARERYIINKTIAKDVVLRQSI